MMKKLQFAGRWLATALLVGGAVFLMAYKYHRAAEKYKPTCQAHVTTIPFLFAEAQDGTDECDDPKKYLPWWYELIAWPEGIQNWAIVVTGIVIGWQAFETRKAAIATAEAAKASRDSLKIQEAAFIQWVEMVDWKIYSEFANEEIDKPRTVEIRVHFAIANKTPRPLTIRSVSTRIQFQNWQTERVFTVNESSKIPPRGKYGVGIAITLEYPQLDLWWTNNLLGTCRVDVSYENALEIKDEWSYPFATKCGRSGSFLLTAFYSATEKS